MARNRASLATDIWVTTTKEILARRGLSLAGSLEQQQKVFNYWLESGSERGSLGRRDELEPKATPTSQMAMPINLDTFISFGSHIYIFS